MSKRKKCGHGNPALRLDGCVKCYQDAAIGKEIVSQARDEFGLEPADIVDLIRKSQGLPPMRNNQPPNPTPERN